MFRSGISVVLLVSVIGVTGCASKAETIGTAGGAALGAAISDGGMFGTVGGAMLGYGVGKAYEQRGR